MSDMGVTPEQLAEIERELDELIEKAAKTDERIDAVKEEAAEAKEQVAEIQRRLRKHSA